MEQIKTLVQEQEAVRHQRHQGPHRPPTAPAWSSRSRTASTPTRCSSNSTSSRRWRTPSGSTWSRSSTASPDPGPEGPAALLRRFPHRGRPATHRVPAGQAQGAPPPRRRPAHRHPRHRRGHPAHPLLDDDTAMARTRLIERVRPQREAGELHPRADPAAPDEVLAHRARAASVTICSEQIAELRRHPRRRERCCAGTVSERAGRRRQGPWHAAPHRAAGVGRCAGRTAPPRSKSPTTPAGSCSPRPVMLARTSQRRRRARRRPARQARRDRRRRPHHGARPVRRGHSISVAWCASAPSNCPPFPRPPAHPTSPAGRRSRHTSIWGRRNACSRSPRSTRRRLAWP
jgi:hypothetical protein